MIFITYKQMLNDIQKLLWKLPHNIDMVIGVPRSGMLPATIIALHLNVPLAFPGIKQQTGGRRFDLNKKIKNVLVVDDSFRSGKSMKQALDKLKDYDFDIKTAVLYTMPNKRNVDYYVRPVKPPRLFEWNIFHRAEISRMAFDIDGVLCRDPTRKENDDGKNYIEFIRNVEPFLVPTVGKMGMIVTSRLEKYREHTEYWLKKHGFKYNKLIMLDVPDAATRRRLGLYAKFKAKVYDSSDCYIFIESDDKQARKIAKMTNKPVLSFNNMRMYK